MPKAVLLLNRSRSTAPATMPLRPFQMLCIRQWAEVLVSALGMVLRYQLFQLVSPPRQAPRFWGASLPVVRKVLGVMAKLDTTRETHGMRLQALHPTRHHNLGRVLRQGHGALRTSGQLQWPNTGLPHQCNPTPHMLGAHVRLQVVLLPKPGLRKQLPKLGVWLPPPHGMAGTKRPQMRQRGLGHPRIRQRML